MYPTKHSLEEKFTKRCRSITEKIAEETSEVEGEWLTVADMEKMEFSERLGYENCKYSACDETLHQAPCPTLILFNLYLL